ncbi:MBL fold metallo-hydrolase [Bacillus paramycoides]|uniref:MBL fold metallo-hydrolase n=1 Tax=Bacillus paramycoides TaxID=2026194 RepID=UPI002E1F46E2|nr:MBL fold metallo-hydrolase [Bacillus paramycoides]
MAKRYENMDNVSTKKSIHSFLRWRKERKQNKKDFSFLVEQSPVKQSKFLQNNFKKTTVTWIGHSTFLIQMNGLNILTDPVWTNKLKLVPRLTQPGLALDELPKIDIVLISHGHYDHLDFSSLRQLNNDVLYLVPIGLKKLFTRKKFTNVKEYSWWDSITIDEVAFHFVPAQHWTRRSLFDMNTSHWGGWIIDNKITSETIYFCGDSGYFKGFKEIGKRFSIDIALMPIGAYEPEWFMKVSHVSPEEAVQAYLDINATHFIPMHYGTFALADETPREAVTRLRNNWNLRMLPWEQLHVLFLGQTFTYNPTILEKEPEKITETSHV